MLKDLLTEIVRLARDSGEPAILKGAPEPSHVYEVVNADGSVEHRIAEPECRDHRADDLETAARWALAFAATPGRQDTGSEGNRVAVWYSRNAVVVLLDDSTRRDKVEVPLAFSPQLLRLQILERCGAMTQKEFVRLLRVDLAGCQQQCPDLLAAARELKFLQHSDGASSVKPGQVSVGKQLRAEMTGVDKLPEYVALTLPVFSAVHTTEYEVNCAVDADPETQKLQLIPLPGAIEDAIQAAESDLGARLHGLLFTTEETPNVSLSFGRP